MNRIVVQVGASVGLLALGVAAFVAMKSMAVVPERHTPEVPAVPVEVVSVVRSDHPAVIVGSGSVQAATRIDLVPQVSGRVVEIARGLTPGQRLAQGALVARIDARDFEAQVVQAEAAVTTARLEVALEEGRGRQNEREWELLGATPESALARRELQADAARANLASAVARLDAAKLALERTRLVAPFDAVVLSESLDVGQVVAPGAPVASLMGTARFRVRVSVPVRDLALLDVPEGVDGHGSEAIVRQPLGDGATLEARGYVLRRLGELDADSRTATVLVVVDNPLDVPAGTTPILPGAFVDVELQGHPMDDVYAVPRTALVNGTQVWVADAGDVLARRDVGVLWADRDTAYVHTGLTEGERVITSPLSLPVPGMKVAVRPASDATAAEATPAEAAPAPAEATPAEAAPAPTPAE